MNNKCSIAENSCEVSSGLMVAGYKDSGLTVAASPGVSVYETTGHVPASNLQRLENAVIVLNEAASKVVGATSYMHWPMIFVGDPEATSIECFLSNETTTTNILGILNGILSFTDSEGFYHRVTYSVEKSLYSIQKQHVGHTESPEAPQV